MDLKALMQKLEIINNKQYLTESEGKEQTDKKTCPPMSHVKKMCQDGKSVAEICKMHPDCDHTELKQMVADCKETMGNDKKKTDESIVFTSSIARGLAEEFGYDLGEELVSEVAFTPEQQAKMGKANPQDPYIVARVLGKDAVPLSHFTDPEDQKIAKQMGFKAGPAAPGGAATKPAKENPHAGQGGTTPAPALVGTQNQAPDAAAQASRIADRMDAEAGANTTGQAAAPAGGATKPAAADPAVAATREKFKALMDKLEKTGGVSGSAPAPSAVPPLTKKPATGAATKPAAAPSGSTMPAVDIMGNPTGIQEDPNEGNEFSGELAKAKASGADEFEVDGNKYPVKETVTYNDDQTLLAIRNIRY